MKTRKIILLAACAVLLFICIIQAVTLNRNTIKIFAYSEEPDEVTIEKADETVALKKIGDEWFIGNQRYEANNSTVDSILNSLKSIKALDKVGNAGNETNQLRYDLTDAKKLIVTAKKGDKILRKVCVGKASATGSQGYVTFDENKDVYLVSGNLQSAFNKSTADLRSNTVLTLNKDLIGAITLKKSDGTEWKVSRTGVAENIQWNIDGHGIVTGAVDGEKATQWFGEFASVTASGWREDNAKPEGTFVVTCEIECGGKTFTVNLYQTKAEAENEPAEYCGTCSETPYAFDLAAYSAKKFLKNSSELLK